MLCIFVTLITTKRFVLTHLPIHYYVALIIYAIVDVLFYKKCSFLAKERQWYTVISYPRNVVTLISRCLQLFCSYDGHLRPKNYHKWLATPCARIVRVSDSIGAPGASKNKTFIMWLLAGTKYWSTFFFLKKKERKQVSIYLHVMGD